MNEKHDTADLVSKALRKAWQLGQTYWQQADSEYPSQWKKADATQATFDQLVEDTRAVILADNSGAQPVPDTTWHSMPAELLDRAIDTIGRFCSDEGWMQSDMDTLDALIAALEVKP